MNGSRKIVSKESNAQIDASVIMVIVKSEGQLFIDFYQWLFGLILMSFEQSGSFYQPERRRYGDKWQNLIELTL